MPAAMFVMSEKPRISMPACRAAIASRAVDIPTMCPPIVLAMRTSAGQGRIPEGEGTDAHLLLDLAADLRLAGGLSAFVQVRNLTDDVYVAARRPAGARPGLPRTFLAGLGWDF